MNQSSFWSDKIYQFSIIIPSRGDLKPLKRSVKGILNTKFLRDFELIVINDGSSKAISSFLSKLRKAGTDVQEIANSQKKGPSGARNQGIIKANGVWLLFVDDDLNIPRNWISQVEPFLEDYDFISCNVQVESKPFNTLPYAYSKAIGFNAKTKFEQLYFALTGFLLVRHQIFSVLGLFDDELCAGEDYIFSQMVAHSRFKMVFLEELVVYHQPKSWKKQFYTMCRINKGKIQRAKRYPEVCAGEALNFIDLLKTIKYLIYNLIYYRQTYFYHHSNVGFWKHQLGQLIYFSLYLSSQILVLLFPNKRFNW
jgi:glycosyltransferase involved in cell wall biosynthesis